MSESADIRNIIDSIRKIAGSDKLGDVKIDICEVKDVDEEERTCSCSSIFSDGDIVYLDVHLSAEPNDGLICIPDIGSTVIILQVVGKNDVYVIKTSDVSKVICVIDGQNKWEFDAAGFAFNGGTFGGLVKVAQLVSKLNVMEQDLNTIKGVFGTWIPVPNDGGAALKALATTWAGASITPTINADIENTKVKH